MHLDALILARLQFAFTLAWHIIFPSFSIGLASFLAVLEGLWLATQREAFKTLYLFWIRIFAISFAMGVVSGVVKDVSRSIRTAGTLAEQVKLLRYYDDEKYFRHQFVALCGLAAPSSPSALWCRPSGSSRPTAGCSTPSASPWTPRAGSSPPTG